MSGYLFVPEARAALRMALQCPKLGSDAEGHIRRALAFLCEPQPRAGLCERDGEPCSPECTRVLALDGRCGRVP